MTQSLETNPHTLEQAHRRIYARFPLRQERLSRRNSWVTAPVPKQVTIRVFVLKAGLRSEPIHCELKVAQLDDYPYEALSYVWGAEGPLETILCCGEPLAIRQNLFTALRRLRRSDADRMLWIDAVCIDQKNLRERGEQVSLMGRIYEAARCVLVWLGEPQPRDSEAFNTIITLGEHIPKREPTLFASFSTSRLSHVQRAEIDSYLVVSHLRFRQLLVFFARPWFERVWVIQEVVRARRALVICGENHMPWEDFARVVLSFSEALGYLMSKYHGESLDGVTALDNLPAMNQLKEQNEHMTLFSILCIASTFKSTDERDKLFALLNLGNRSSLRIQPDYTSHYFDVFRKHVVYELTYRQRLDYLARPPVRRQDWPSWCPDWTEKSRSSYFYTAIGHGFRAALDTVPILTVRGNMLTIKGKLVDHIAHLAAPMDRSGAYRQNNRDGAETIDPEEIIQWLENCMRLVPLRLDLIRDMDHSALDPFLKTFACVGVHGRPRRKSSLLRWVHDDVADLKHILGRLATATEPARRSRNTQQELLESVTDLASRLYPAITDRQFFRTASRRRLGWVSKRARPGDAICVFYGGAVPFVLREQSDGCWKIVGECYTDGYMQGQAMEITKLQDLDFQIT